MKEDDPRATWAALQALSDDLDTAEAAGTISAAEAATRRAEIDRLRRASFPEEACDPPTATKREDGR